MKWPLVFRWPTALPQTPARDDDALQQMCDRRQVERTLADLRRRVVALEVAAVAPLDEDREG